MRMLSPFDNCRSAFPYKRQSGPSLPPADYTYQQTLTVAGPAPRYGFKSGNYGQLGDGSADDRTWESEALVEFWVEKPSTYRALISFSSNPFLTYTTPNNLFFRVNNTDFFEISSSGSSYFQTYTSDATLAAIWSELDANNGGTVDLVIQARSA